jgi:hypothetical protein
MFDELAKDKLLWLPESGIGFYPVTDSPYDESYFKKYVEMAKTDIGIKLTQARVDLVNKYTKDEVIDIGIGCGNFIEARERTYGFDINPFGVQWLNDNCKYKNPFNGSNNLTFWDSLEHIHEPNNLLEKCNGYVFVSLPIFLSSEHILVSKHFRKDEHCWYFTDEGIKIFMWTHGFKCLESNTMESDIGREDIGTYVFERT